jgi:RNA polymerase sigma-70 factor (ECF subfamily)
VTNTLGHVLSAGTSHTPLPEKDWVALIHRIASGDPEALYSLYERTHRIVFTLLLRILRDRHTAEEVTLDVFHDVWRRAASYSPAGGPVIGWIMNQARSRAIDRLRFEQRKKRAPRAGQGTPPEEPIGAADVAVERRERDRRLREALSLLTSDERQAIETAYFSELSYREVATMLKQPVGTIKTRIRSGLAKLRRALSPVSTEL